MSINTEVNYGLKIMSTNFVLDIGYVEMNNKFTTYFSTQ